MRKRILGAIAVASIVLFVSLAVLVRTGSLGAFDTAVMHAVHAVSGPTLVHVARMLSVIGTLPALLVPILAILLWAAMRRDRAAVIVFAVICIANGPLNMLLKHGFQRIRPELWPRVEMLSYAFPSGHAMTSVALFGMMAVVAARLRPGAALLVRIAAPLMAIGIGLSRVVLGVHWPSDVLAGWAAGTVLLVIGVLGVRYRR